MAITEKPCIAYAEKVEDGLLVAFTDGRSAIYSCSLLRAVLPPIEQRNDLFFEEQPPPIATRRGWRNLIS